MLMNLAAVMPAMAMTVNVGSGYEFVDTAYSPKKDIYVAVARNSGGTAKIYYSNGGETWQEAERTADSKTFDMRANIQPNSQQRVVWWPKEQVFVTFHIVPNAEKLLCSEDGKTWTEFSRTGTNYLYAVSGDGQQLAVMRHVLIALDSLEEGNMSALPTVDIRGLGNDSSGAGMMAVGVSDTAPYIYAVFRQKGNGMRIAAQPIVPTPEPTEEAQLAEAETAEEAVEEIAEPTAEPVEATTEPTAEPTVEPVEATAEPAEATVEPTAEPTAEPVEETAEPVEETAEPVEATAEPTAEPVEETAEPELMTAEAEAEPKMAGAELMAETTDYTKYATTDVAYNFTQDPIDAIWSKPMAGWFVINGAELTFVKPERTTAKPTATAKGATELSMSDGGKASGEKFTAAGTNSDTVIVGTESGKLYAAAASENIMDEGSLAWSRVEPGADVETEINERVKSISEINDNAFFFATNTGLYTAARESDGSWRYHDIAKSNIIADSDTSKTRIEVPEEGSTSVTLTPESRTWAGYQSQNTITGISIDNAEMPQGVNAEVSGGSVNVTVESTADPEADNNIDVTVTTASSQAYSFEITVVSPAQPDVTGYDEMAIPQRGTAAKEYQYSAVIMGTDGLPMETREARMEVIEVPEGVEFDPATGIFTVTEDAKAGTVLLHIYPGDTTENPTIKEITLSESHSVRAEITLGPAELQIPDDAALNQEYTATFYSQIDEVMIHESPVWTVEIPEGSEAGGISMDDGKLSVPSNATAGKIIIRAVSSDNPEIYAEKEVELTYTDKRKATEDLSPITFDTSKPLEDDLTFITTGAEFGSTITYKSSDENILKPDGTLIRPSREDGSVILTATSTLGSGRAEKQWEFKVTKADDLSANGDLSDGTTAGWTPEDGAQLEVTSEEDNNILNVTGGGVYQTFEFTNESSYGFEARVRAAAGSTITLLSEAGGKIAEITADGDWQELKGSVTFKRQSDNFEDKVYIRYSTASRSGDFSVDYLKAYEITLELSKVQNAVNKATYSKTQADIDAAEKLLEEFYDLPIKDEMQKTLDDIEPVNSGSGSGGGGGGGGSSSGGGGGGGGGVSRPPSTVDTITGPNNISTPSKGEDDYEDELDTYLLHFKDMKNHWAREDVEYMAELGIIQGKEEDKFMPDDKITRAEFAVLITRTLGLSETPYENSFFDVVADDWYSGYVQTVRSNNFMNGYDGLFNPDSNITREEIAKVIVAAYNSRTNTALETGKSIYFNDIDMISSWAWDYVAEAAELGFVNGMTEELFMPKETATRAQAATMLRRVYDTLNPTSTGDSESEAA